MLQLTDKQIERFKFLAKRNTSQETYVDEWNPFEFSGGNFDDAYQVGCDDSDTENARFILDLFEIEY